MIAFINAFKNTSYYQSLFNHHNEILGIYILGSMSMDIIDERSDYDIVILTLDGEYIDASKYEHLIYKDRKVHWYYRSIESLFDSKHLDTQKYLCPIQLRNIREDLTIYENPKYINTLNKLYAIKDNLSKLGMYRLFEIQKTYINDVINESQILEKYYTKYLYHLCLASYYLTEEEPNKEFLRILKRIKWQPVSDVYKNLAVERLKIYKDYIETHPVDLKTSFNNLYMELMIHE